MYCLCPAFCYIPMITKRDLVGAGGAVVGEVTVTVVGNEVIVTITVKPGNTLSEAYIYLGSQAVPITKGGAVDLVQFPFVQNGLSGNTITYSVSVCPPASLFFLLQF